MIWNPYHQPNPNDSHLSFLSPTHVSTHIPISLVSTIGVWCLKIDIWNNIVISVRIITDMSNRVLHQKLKQLAAEHQKLNKELLLSSNVAGGTLPLLNVLVFIIARVKPNFEFYTITSMLPAVWVFGVQLDYSYRLKSVWVTVVKCISWTTVAALADMLLKKCVLWKIDFLIGLLSIPWMRWKLRYNFRKLQVFFARIPRGWCFFLY